MKSNPKRLLSAHFGSYADARTGRIRLQDHAMFEGIPVVVAGGCVLLEVKLPAAASVGLLTVSGLLSAFLFGAMLQVSARAMDWADANPARGPATSAHAIFLREISANAGYASLVCIVTSIAFIVAATTPKTAPVAASAVGLGFATHLVLILLLVMTRVFAVTEERLVQARTGATVTPLPKRGKTG